MAKLVAYEKSGSLFAFDPKSLDEIADLIRWAETDVPRLAMRIVARAAMYMALYHQGEARKMSFGPYDPSGMNSSLAWRTPEQGIRRISQNYYLSWKVRSAGAGIWRVFNDSREAYFIEYGISEVGWGQNRHVPARRIRRPVNKLAGRRTIQWAMSSAGINMRLWTEVYRGSGKYRFTQIVNAPGGTRITGWENISRRSAISAARGGTQIRFRGPTGFQRPIFNKSNDVGSGPLPGRRLPG